MLGAEGVQCGTRFLCANECQIHENYKKKVLAARDIDTQARVSYVRYPCGAKNPMRAMHDMEYDSAENNEEPRAGWRAGGSAAPAPPSRAIWKLARSWRARSPRW